VRSINFFVGILLLIGFATAVVAAPVYRVKYLGFTNPNSLGWNINNNGQLTGMTGSFAGFVYNYNSSAYSFLPGLGGLYNALPGAINDAGQVAGVAQNSSIVNHAVLYSEGVLTDLGVLPGYRSSVSTGINNNGHVVGYSELNSSFSTRAFLYQNGTMHDLGVGVPNAINDSGVIIGTSSDRAVKYEGGSVVDLGDFGDSRLTSAIDINNLGQIVGRSYVNTGTGYNSYPFIYEAGEWHNLGLPEGVPLGIPVAINNRGEVIGNSNSSQGSNNRPPFVYTRSKMWNLQTLLDESGNGLNLQLVYDIDDRGRIYAQGNTGSGYRAVLLIPTPEPTSAIMLAVGLGFVFQNRVCRRLR
jgi:probable HAF family extracellular repeat protein